MFILYDSRNKFCTHCILMLLIIVHAELLHTGDIYFAFSL